MKTLLDLQRKCVSFCRGAHVFLTNGNNMQYGQCLALRKYMTNTFELLKILLTIESLAFSIGLGKYIHSSIIG